MTTENKSTDYTQYALCEGSTYVVLCETSLGKFYLFTNRGWAANENLTAKQMQNHLNNAISKGEVWDKDGNLPPLRTALSLDVWKIQNETLVPFTDFVRI